MVVDDTRSRTALALHGGIGIALDLGRAQPFTELRCQLVDDRSPGAVGEIVPLVPGVRF